MLAAASAGHALSLGSPRGAAVVGQPLQLVFDLALDGPSDGGSACVQAELFYGDTRVDPSRVQVATLAGAQASQLRIQLVSAIAVNEPVVSVNLRAGCGQGLSRRYVLLASSPTAQADPVPAVALPERSSEQARRSGTALPPLASADSGFAGRTASPSASGRSGPTAQGSKSSASTPSSAGRKAEAAPARKAPAAGAPRLELQSPTDWLEEHNLPLRPSIDMAAPAATVTPEQRAMAAAAWRRLFAEAAPETAALTDDAQARSAQTLQDQVKTLQGTAARDRARAAELQARVDEAESDRQLYLWGAIGALALLLAALVFFLLGRSGRRNAPGAVWWRPRQPAGSAPVAPQFQDSALEPLHAAAPTMAAARPAAGALARTPQDLPQQHAADTASSFDERFGSLVEAETDPVRHILTAAPVPMGSSSAAAAQAAAHELRQLDTDALLDVQQNAEFYVSLGQYEQAIELLQGYIAAHPGVNPAVYLDLLKILHTLSLTDAYRKLRDEFNTTFNADVPVFAGFLKSRRRLEDYPEALARIEAHWEREDILDVVEDYLFRKPGHQPAAPFELEAYRELLLLHAVARIAIQQDPSSRQGGTVRGTLSSADAGTPPAAGFAGIAAAAGAGASDFDAFSASHGSGASPTAQGIPPASDVFDDYRPSFSLEQLRKDQADDGAVQEPMGFDMPTQSPSKLDPPATAAPTGFGHAPPTDDNLIDFDLLDLEALHKESPPKSSS